MTRKEKIKELKEYKKRVLEYVKNIEAFMDEKTENRFAPICESKTNNKVKVLKLDYIK